MNVEVLVLTAAELAVVTAMAVFFSSASTPVLSAIMTTVAFAAGHLADWIMILAEMAAPKAGGGGSAAVAKLLTCAYYAVPNLESFNIRNIAVHADVSSMGPLPPVQMANLILIAACWSAVFITAAVVVFRRREL
jgi:ABC-type transport system involved in multi-copper enzyme maturation permease subunit